MNKWHLIIDVEKCEDCNNCFLACKDEHVDNDWPGYTASQPKHGHRWMNIMRVERGQFPLIDVAYRPTPCMHCDNAPCVAAAREDAVYKRDDGVVLIDPEKAKGQKELLKACPYGAIWWNDEENVPQKCTMCAHLLDSGWKQPRCVQVCPTGALKFVNIDEEEMLKEVDAQKLQVLSAEFKTRPRVYYKNLHRFERCFIAGSVSVKVDEIIDCVQGAAVVLKKNEEVVTEATTDHYGDFKFDYIEPNSGSYQVHIFHDKFEPKEISVEVTENCISLREIVFE